MENNENKNKTLKILFLILILTVIGVASWFVYDKTIKKDEPKQNEVETTESEKDKVIKRAEEIIRGTSGIYNKNSFNNMTNQDKLFASMILTTQDIDEFEKLTTDEILAMFKKYFGSSYLVEIEKNIFNPMLDDKTVLCTLNSKTKKYECEDSGFGLDLSELVKQTLIDYKEEDGKYYLTYKQLFDCTLHGDEEEDEGLQIKYCNADNEQVYVKKIVGDDTTEEDYIISDEVFNSFIDKLTLTKYTFEYEDGNLVLKNIE